MKTTFTNELGREISVEVKRHTPEDRVPRVTYTITGPDSETENTLTVMEFDELMRLGTRERHFGDLVEPPVFPSATARASWAGVP